MLRLGQVLYFLVVNLSVYSFMASSFDTLLRKLFSTKDDRNTHLKLLFETLNVFLFFHLNLEQSECDSITTHLLSSYKVLGRKETDRMQFIFPLNSQTYIVVYFWIFFFFL